MCDAVWPLLLLLQTFSTTSFSSDGRVHYDQRDGGRVNNYKSGEVPNNEHPHGGTKNVCNMILKLYESERALDFITEKKIIRNWHEEM